MRSPNCRNMSQDDCRISPQCFWSDEEKSCLRRRSPASNAFQGMLPRDLYGSVVGYLNNDDILKGFYSTDYLRGNAVDIMNDAIRTNARDVVEMLEPEMLLNDANAQATIDRRREFVRTAIEFDSWDVVLYYLEYDGFLSEDVLRELAFSKKKINDNIIKIIVDQHPHQLNTREYLLLLIITEGNKNFPMFHYVVESARKQFNQGRTDLSMILPFSNKYK